MPVIIAKNYCGKKRSSCKYYDLYLIVFSQGDSKALVVTVDVVFLSFFFLLEYCLSGRCLIHVQYKQRYISFEFAASLCSIRRGHISLFLQISAQMLI